MMQQTKNRWLIVLAAIGIHISIGSVYAWSVLTKPIMQAMGFSLKEVTWTFSLAILFLGTSAGFLGTYVEKYGPRRSGLISMCFFVSGLLGTAYALTQHSLLLLYLFYGVIGGIGLGTGYITPVSTLVKWFPNNRGLATGLAIMGFGFASLVAGPLMQILIAKYGLVENFVILACIYAVVMTASALYLEPPKQETAAGKGQFKAKMPEHVQYSVKEAMHTWQFYALWWIFFTNITCGIGLLAVASPMAQEVIVPINKGEEQLAQITAKLQPVIDQLRELGITVKYDDNPAKRPGFKFADYELKGVPVRLAMGGRDLENNTIEIMRRDTLEKENVSFDGIVERVKNMLEDIQKNIFEKARAYRDAHVYECDNYEEFKERVKNGGFFLCHWDGTAETEAKIKEETQATIRCVPFAYEQTPGVDMVSGKPAVARVIIARSY